MEPVSKSELNLKLREIFEQAGYRRYKMSKFEEYDLYAKNKDFLVSENVLTFTDLDGKLMALKPDVTLSIIKNSVESGVEKVYYHENVYRASSGDLGFREITQAGLECIGEVDEYSVCEVLGLAAKSLIAISPKCELDISHLGLLDELMTAAGLSESAKNAASGLMSEKNIEELLKLLDQEDVKDGYKEKIAGLANLDDDAGTASKKLRELLSGSVSEEILELFCDTCEFLNAEFPDTVRVDFSTVGDRGYYSGIFFKGYVDGVPSGVLSGGQYGGLMKKLGKNAKAIGFAIYLDLLEPLFVSQNDYDADILLIYNDAKPKDIYAAAKRLSEDGKSVLTLKSMPKGMRFKEIYSIDAGGEDLEG